MTSRQSEFSEPVVIMTGSSGLIGRRVAAKMKNDFTLVGLDTTAPPPQSGIDHVETDLTDDSSVERALDQISSQYGPDIASVIHLAAWYDFSGDPGPLYEELTVEGTRRLLQQLRSRSLKVHQFVFSSSLLVMKPSDEQPVSEFSDTRAEWAYPKSKLQAESVLEQECGDIPTVILRIAGVYDEQCHSLPISQQIARIHEKQLESYVFPGDPDHGQALVHLDDLAACFRKVVDRRELLAPHELFLIAEPDVMSYEELQDAIGTEIHGMEWPTLRLPKAIAKTGAYLKQIVADDDKQPFIRPWMIDLADDHYEPTITHARTSLAWEPQHRLRQTLPAIIEFLQRDPVGFYQTNKLPIPAELEAGN